MLLVETYLRMGLTQAAADATGDDPCRKSDVHATREFLRQRVYGLVLGREGLNDQDKLRRDPTLRANRRFVTGKLPLARGFCRPTATWLLRPGTSSSKLSAAALGAGLPNAERVPCRDRGCCLIRHAQTPKGTEPLQQLSLWPVTA